METRREFTDAERKITLAGVMIVFLLSALDQTIVATAMPVIISQLHGLGLYAWVTTSYLLASTVMVPIWGKLGDLYGRKPVLIAGILLFLAGSWLSGLSGEFGDLPLLGGGMVQLIVFRAIQGLGGGALFTTAFAIIADLFPPRERGKFGGLFGAVFGVSSAIGPLLGGYFTDHGTVTILGHVVAGWRWVFYLNLPMGLIALFMVIAKMPQLSHAAKGKIDFLGAALILCSSIPLLLALSFGGQSYAWGSPQVLGLFAMFAVSTVLFVIVENRVEEPILHLELFKNPVFLWANTAGFFSSMSFLSVVAFLPLFMQLGQGVKATTSGLSTLPLMGGIMGSSMVSGWLVSRTGRYKLLMVGGLLVTAFGIFMLSRMDADTSLIDLGWRMAVLGVGLGPGQSLFALAVQNAVPASQLGVVTSSSQFFRQIGSTIGVAIFGTLLTASLNSSLGRIMPGVDVNKLRGMGAAAQGGAALALPHVVKMAIAGAITHVFAMGLIVVAAALVAAFLIPELPMRDLDALRAEAPDKDGDTAMPLDAHL